MQPRQASALAHIMQEEAWQRVKKSVWVNSLKIVVTRKKFQSLTVPAAIATLKNWPKAEWLKTTIFFFILTECVGQKFRQKTAAMACLWSTIPRKHSKVGDYVQDGSWISMKICSFACMAAGLGRHPCCCQEHLRVASPCDLGSSQPGGFRVTGIFTCQLRSPFASI